LIASALAKNADKLPDVIWGPTMQYFDYHGDRFSIPIFTDLVYKLLEEATELVDDLCLSAYRHSFGTVEDEVFLFGIKEYPRNPTNNYCFVNDPHNIQLTGLLSHCLSIIEDTSALHDAWLVQLPSSPIIYFSLERAKSYVCNTERLPACMFNDAHLFRFG